MESRYAVINVQALAYNFAAVKKQVGPAMIMAVVKANAYGHGLVQCASFLQSLGANYFGVAFIQEAITLRRAGIIQPILVLGGIMIEQIPLFLQYDIEIMASSVTKLLAINESAAKLRKKALVHLKIDTGLGRIGVRHDHAEDFFKQAMNLSNISIVGVASHFATSDDQNIEYMHQQCQNFIQATLWFTENGYSMPIRHIANSGAIMQYPESYFDMVRPGIMLYGVYPQSWMKSLLRLEPVLSLYARIVYFKVVIQDQGVSYGHSWIAEKNTRVITLPVGYGDGYPKALSNKGFVIINGIFHPLIGNICMDQMMVDIGQSSAFCGDEVVLVGKFGNAEITVNNLVDWYGGSAYEFLVVLNSRISKRYENRPESMIDRALTYKNEDSVQVINNHELIF